MWRQCILMITSSTLHLHRLMIVLSLNINVFLSVYNYQFCMVCTVHNLKLNKTRLNVVKENHFIDQICFPVIHLLVKDHY